MAVLFDSLAGRTGLTQSCAVFVNTHSNAFCNRLKAASDEISGRFVGPIVTDKRVKFRDLCLNRSREYQPKATGGGIFNFFFVITSDQK